MTDVHCANCGEPWDTVHLREDEIWNGITEGHLDIDQLNAWNGALDDEPVARAFEQRGWKFAGSIYAVLECPDCKRNGPLRNHKARTALITIAAELLGDDEDALIAFLEDIEGNI